MSKKVYLVGFSNSFNSNVFRSTLQNSFNVDPYSIEYVLPEDVYKYDPKEHTIFIIFAGLSIGDEDPLDYDGLEKDGYLVFSVIELGRIADNDIHKDAFLQYIENPCLDSYESFKFIQENF